MITPLTTKYWPATGSVWQISERVMEVGRNGALIDIRNNAGAALTTAGLTG